MARATSAASAIASTTVAGPRRQSPAAQTPSTPVEVAARRPRRSCSTPAASYRLASIPSPTAQITVVAGSSTVSPVATGLRRPLASGSPSSITSQVSTAPLSALGASSSQNSTPSARARSSSSSSAGICFLVRRYTRRTFFTPARRLATRAASMAVLPAPMTTTSSPSSSFSPLLAASRNSSTSSSAPSPKPAEPGIQAPVATTTSVKP